MNAPRVLHLDHTASAGGAEYALVRMLCADPAWQPAVLLPRGAAGPVYEPLTGRVPVRTAGFAQPAGVGAGGPRRTLAAGIRLVAQAAALRLHPGFRTADIVDANTTRAAAYASLAAQTSRVPLVIHLRDIIDAESLGSLGHRVMTGIALPRAQGVIANSQTTLDSAQPYLRAGAATAVIPSASGLRPRPHPRRAREPGRPLHIGMLARIDPWKGQRELLDAFIAAFPEGDVRLQFAGAPLFGHDDYEAVLRTVATEAGVGGRVDFLGHVDDIDAVLETWDVAVQYSTRPEPLGQNVLQYLASGAATIVADEAGPAEWVADGENGLRIAPRNVPALGAALRRLGADADLRARLGAQAAATPGLLDDADVAARHADFYKRIRSGAQR
ncbi:glycosyltransferase family 4 protein [Microbacterium sp.]|uniref:glycosyltransferase family 4 protein n=1 Tax=Microbacterium sp. TaxID=51671 RepID=UPI0037CA6D04